MFYRPCNCSLVPALSMALIRTRWQHISLTKQQCSFRPRKVLNIEILPSKHYLLSTDEVLHLTVVNNSQRNHPSVFLSVDEEHSWLIQQCRGDQASNPSVCHIGAFCRTINDRRIFRIAASSFRQLPQV